MITDLNRPPIFAARFSMTFDILHIPSTFENLTSTPRENLTTQTKFSNRTFWPKKLT
ncbi:MAG: hypothetical protein F6K22_36820 [Okeania sp. SIO2F4]|uniref:hypothetical protein n=1 Tax=Okeania sp. SIO2F4 TaxID=2607790 RepID=UPI00142A75D0|nr:hypothetical protein [Okeania sp. SIO2F4]NES07865.1 hypothetical protein [Okeania sp. SIO2F4]